MRKGQKLYRYLQSIIEDAGGSKYLSPSANEAHGLWTALEYLNQLTDEEFNKIVYDVENNENWVEGYEIGKGT